MPLADGDLLLLCSDGLNSMIPDEDIHRILTSSGPEEVCQALIDAANNHGGHDNTTVVAAAVGAQRAVATYPSAADQITQEVPIGSPWWKSVARAILRRR